MSGRCVECDSLTPAGWQFCRRCHAWNDLYEGVQHAGTIGIDEHRLRRGLSFLRPRRSRVTVAMFEQLTRRVRELEDMLL